MSQLRFEKKHIRGANLNGASVLPNIRTNLHFQVQKFRMDEEDELFVGYGQVRGYFPYTLQDRYDRANDQQTWDVAVLENEYLRATFVPSLGGKLWSLYDKEHKCDLVTDNPVFWPGNFAARGAWSSGGIEFNMGAPGHSVLTCENLFTAHTTTEDGTPVLRFYEFERIRGCCYQMDFCLPEGSRFLFAHMRIHNHSDQTVPMYWWTNIAVPEREGYRVVVPATSSFTGTYISLEEKGLGKREIPMTDGFDCTYPTNHPNSLDHFFNIPKDCRKFEAQLDPQGFGFVHASTRRLQGRKLFVFGQNNGGQNWQALLSDLEVGEPYQEMQAGLARTQSECLPMPPQTAWTWVEAYGAITADPAKVHGEWNGAIAEVQARLDQILPESVLDERLETYKTTLAKKPAQLWKTASGWGALENYRLAAKKREPMNTHLDFGPLQEAQMPWKHLLDYGYMPQVDPKAEPVSYMLQDEYFELLKDAVRGPDAGNWFTWFHLSLNYLMRAEVDLAKQAIDRSLSLADSCWGLYTLANIQRAQGDKRLAGTTMRRAFEMRPDDESLARETFRTLVESEQYMVIRTLYDKANDHIKSIPLLQLLYARALAYTGELEAANTILFANGGLKVPDLREGETSLSELFIHIQSERARKEKRPFSRDQVEIPASLDFRMGVPTKKKK